MTIQRLIDLLTIIANSEGNTLKVVANGKPIKDLCMSEGNIVLLRTSDFMLRGGELIGRN